MAEALAVVGAVANIVQLVDFGSRVLKRLEEYQSWLGDIPETFCHIKVELPALLDALRQTEEAINVGSTQYETKKALLPIIERCGMQIKLLDEVIVQVLPSPSDSWVVRGRKAFKSLRCDTKVEKITTVVRGFTQTLTYHTTASLRAQGHRVPQPLPSSTVPFRRDPHFVDRGIFTEIFDKSRQPASRVALVGLGGVGKSQLAVEYSYRVREKSPTTWVFWVHASSTTRFEEGYLKIARQANLSGWDKPDTDILNLVYHWLSDENNGEWVMIIDNADDLNTFCCQSTRGDFGKVATTLLELLPQSPNGSILVTSRNRHVAFQLIGSYADIITIHPMTQTHAISLLQNKLEMGFEQRDAMALIEALDCMPLAITQAAAYISQRAPRATVSRYLQNLCKGDKERAKLLETDIRDARRDGTASNSIVATWQISFEYIRSVRPSATQLLSLMSLFDWQGIPEALLSDQYQKDNDDSCNFEEDINLLLSFSLVTADVDGHQFKMHRLVQFSTKKWLELQSELDTWQEKYVILMDNSYPEGEYKNWEKCQALFSHAQATVAYRPTSGSALEAWASVLDKAAWYANEVGSHQTAQEMCKSSLEAREAALGSEDPCTLRSINSLGNALRRLGRYEEAEAMHRQSLNVREKMLGPEHSDTLVSINSLGVDLRTLGRCNEAEVMHRRSLSVREKILGSEHPDTLVSINNLAVVLNDLGRCEEAEAMHRRALNVQEKILGPEHPHTLVIVNNLALALQSLGRCEEAEVMHRQVFSKMEKVLGPKNPRTLQSLNNLALTLESLGRYKEAEVIYWRVLLIREEVLGPQHPDTLGCFYNLGEVLESLERQEETMRQVTESDVNFGT